MEAILLGFIFLIYPVMVLIIPGFHYTHGVITACHIRPFNAFM
jgi:hypothetical protein